MALIWQFLKKINGIERFLFLFCAILNLLPIISHSFFPSMDGPAHMYNANLMSELIANPNGFISNYFHYNTGLITNFSGHYLLLFFNLFLPVLIAQKVVLVLYALGIPYSIRYLILQINPQGVGVSYFSFPFVYSFVFLLGFYNFSLALVFFFFGLGYWQKHQHQKLSVLQLILLFLLLLATLFSHLFVFSILLLCLGLPIILEFVAVSISGDKKFNFVFLKLKNLAIVSLLPFFLFVYYFVSRPASSNQQYLPINQLMDDLISLRPIVAYDSNFEGIYVSYIWYTLLILLAVKIGIRFYKKWAKVSSSQWFYKGDVWLLLVIILGAMYFYLPDSNSFGGFISIRVALLFYVLLVIWLSTENLPKGILILGIATVLFSSVNLNFYYSQTMKNLSLLAADCYETAYHIESESVVLPMNYTKEWNTIHYSNYLGIEKPLVILDNYEAVNDYFPLSWKWQNLPNSWVESMSTNSFNCVNFTENGKNELPIDYIFVLKNRDQSYAECDISYSNLISQYYQEIFENKSCLLYKRIKTTEN